MNWTQLTGTVIFGIIFSLQSVQEKTWQNIIPLHSTRKDVERLIGSPQQTKGVAATFELKDGRLRVFYSDGSCKRRNTNDWNVPAETVVSLTFEPRSELLIADLKLDMTKYKRDNDPHLRTAIHYYNRQAGIRISTRLEKEGEDIQSITYEPAEKDFHLRCEQPSQALDLREIYPGLAFDEYGKLSFNLEKPRLDNLATYLKKTEPTYLAYYLIYRSRDMGSVEADRRSKRAKAYMVKMHHIDAKRIVTTVAGCREELEIVLYVIPNSMAPPVSRPDCEK